MKIYTGDGDEGYTDLPPGRRVRKYDPMIAAGGAVDELNSTLGWVLRAAADGGHAGIVDAIKPVQAELLAAGALVATAGSRPAVKVNLGQPDILRMEGQIDRATEALPALTGFVVPGGCETACRLHIARTVCRRAERAVTRAASAETRLPKLVFRYLNRLGDLLFVLARLADADPGGHSDVEPGGAAGK